MAPSWSWNVPGGQLAHSEAPDAADMLPGRHSTGAAEPREHAEPGGQLWHCSAALRSVAPEKVPAGHGVEEMLPAGQ